MCHPNGAQGARARPFACADASPPTTAPLESTVLLADDDHTSVSCAPHVGVGTMGGGAIKSASRGGAGEHGADGPMARRCWAELHPAKARKEPEPVVALVVQPLTKQALMMHQVGLMEEQARALDRRLEQLEEALASLNRRG
eukprot:CAMPEP_0170306716 /NCGR_PEP_ID=MMETSP0116_2-20130129/53754_1 /TAXON_ID=400756 /ORGANISM="Durinskia baltica, Strain CSIRO CS-38" /LENGTH=141 /DNA_ID=CAMNT_0010558811 /DNA_START=51 /DNA_END=473 /DNA_ORIENTATION=-